MAKTNGRFKEPKGRTALPNLFADTLCFEAHPFRYFPEAKFTSVVMRVFSIIPAAKCWQLTSFLTGDSYI